MLFPEITIVKGVLIKVGSFRRIYKQDYSPQNQPDIDTLSISLNDSFDTIYGALNNQITFADNLNCTVTSFTTSVNSSFAPIAPIIIKLATYQKTVNGILVINVTSGGNKTALPDAGVYINYTINNNTSSSSNTTNSGNTASNPLTININYIKGLPVGTAFTITAILI